MKVWLVGIDRRGCTDPMCCGEYPDYTFEVFLNEKDAELYVGGPRYRNRADIFTELEVHETWPPRV